MALLSPMMAQYFRIKEENPGTILFFRLGDFYEMFYDDAKLVSKELELTLTQKACGQAEKAPMCGVPFHSCEGYIARLVDKGYKVAICEQTEDPATAKGLVKRGIVRVVTPGTVTESSMLDEGKNNFLASVYRSGDGAAIAFVDTSTGQFYLTELSGQNVDESIVNELGSFCPTEVIANKAAVSDAVSAFMRDRLGCCFDLLDEEKFDFSRCEKALTDHFSAKDLGDLGLDGKKEAVGAAGCALEYLFATRMTGLENITKIEIYASSQFMKLDLSARRNLELFETMRSKEKKGSLLWVLDKTNTAMGKRMQAQTLRIFCPLPLPRLIFRSLRSCFKIQNPPCLRRYIRTSTSFTIYASLWVSPLTNRLPPL